MTGEVLIPIDQLNVWRETLVAAMSYVNAVDLAESQRVMLSEPKESALAKELRASINEVEEHIGAYLDRQYQEGRFDRFLKEEPDAGA